MDFKDEYFFWYTKATEELNLSHRAANDYAVATTRYKRGMDTLFLIVDGLPVIKEGKVLRKPTESYKQGWEVK